MTRTSAQPVRIDDGSDQRGRLPTLEFDDFYREHFGRLVLLAAAVAGERIGAEDAAQDAMVAAHLEWARISVYEAPYAWVRRVAVQRALKTRRRRALADRVALRLVRDDVAETPTRDDDLWAALASLTPKQRGAVTLHHLEGLTLAEIAEVLGCAPGTVKTHLHRGRAIMASLLSDPIEGAS